MGYTKMSVAKPIRLLGEKFDEVEAIIEKRIIDIKSNMETFPTLDSHSELNSSQCDLSLIKEIRAEFDKLNYDEIALEYQFIDLIPESMELKDDMLNRFVDEFERCRDETGLDQLQADIMTLILAEIEEEKEDKTPCDEYGAAELDR